MKVIMTTQLHNMIEKYDMLSSQQIKACQNKFTETALTLLLSQIHIVWEKKNSVATLLSFNMSETFLKILQKQLIHVMKKKEVFRWLINWISLFMLNKKIILIFDNQKFRILNISMRISQNSFLSSILFLFYNVKLLKICNSTQVRVSSLAFINDVNFLIYELITEKNCKQLKAFHDKCFFWIKKYETLFILKKYILMYFSRKRKFNMKALIQLKSIEKKSEKFTQMFEIWFNSQLNWNSHLDKIMQKMKNQINALFKITEFI